MPNHAHFADSPHLTPKDHSSAGTPTTDAPNPFSRPSSPVGQVAPDKKLHVGFIGLGNMGQKMALYVYGLNIARSSEIRELPTSPAPGIANIRRLTVLESAALPPSCSNLAKHLQETQQPPLKVWNRSQDRIDKFSRLAEHVPTQVAQSVKEIGESASPIRDLAGGSGASG